MRNVLKREKSLERRLIESREREADLEMMITELEDKLSLYEQFMGDTSHLSVANFSMQETDTSFDVHIRYDPAVPRLEYIPTKNNKEYPLQYHTIFGVFEMAKLFLGNRLQIRHRDRDE